MTRHSPTPWGYSARLSASENHKGFVLFSVNHYGIADVFPIDPDGDEGEANACLIAAAPELLAASERALKAMSEAFGVKPEWDDERIYDELPSSVMGAAYFATRDAVLKATGAQP